MPDIFPPERRIFGPCFTEGERLATIIRLAWWMLLGIYLISAVVTVRGMVG